MKAQVNKIVKKISYKKEKRLFLISYQEIWGNNGLNIRGGKIINL